MWAFIGESNPNIEAQRDTRHTLRTRYVPNTALPLLCSAGCPEDILDVSQQRVQRWCFIATVAWNKFFGTLGKPSRNSVSVGTWSSHGSYGQLWVFAHHFVCLRITKLSWFYVIICYQRRVSHDRDTHERSPAGQTRLERKFFVM
jgi:hypothetical protein